MHDSAGYIRHHNNSPVLLARTKPRPNCAHHLMVGKTLGGLWASSDPHGSKHYYYSWGRCCCIKTVIELVGQDSPAWAPLSKHWNAFRVGWLVKDAWPWTDVARRLFCVPSCEDDLNGMLVTGDDD